MDVEINKGYDLRPILPELGHLSALAGRVGY
jgi:hypothetical protein